MTLQAAHNLPSVEQVGGQISILIVDDRPTGRAVLRAALFDPSYTITEAENGEQALELVFEQNFDIVILDLIMPGLDGYEVLESIRNKYSPLELPVVVVTVRDDVSDVVKALKLGANDYVTKPIDEHILNARLASQVLRKRAEDVLRKSYHRLEGLVRDRTAQLREANKALSKSEQRFRSLYNDTPAMFFTIDSNNMIVSVNLFGAKYLGYEINELVGKPVTMLYPDNEKSKVIEQISSSLFKKGIERREMEMRHRNGDSIWVRQTSQQAELEGGNRNVLSVCEDITEAYLLAQKLAYQANHDNLTGLINRREFEQKLGQILDTLATDEAGHILCFIDLDQLGRINNSCGHVAGDTCLTNVSGRMQQGLHEGDILARIGGDEFALLLTNCTIIEAVRKAELLRKAVEEDDFVWQGIRLSITISIGIIPISADNRGISQLMASAAAACSEIKANGGNGVKVGNIGMTGARGDIDRIGLVNQALENDAFELHGEILLPLSGEGKKPAMEVLLRLQQTDGDLVYPDDFIPTAEYFNMMHKLDRWVIQACFSWLGRNPRVFGDLDMYSINLSGQSLADETLTGYILESARQVDVPLHKICFEITETVAIANLAKAKYLINALKRHKTRVALDDFGRGLSSLMYLKSLQVDFVKIDGVFIREINQSKQDKAVVKIISDTAHALGKQTIAEYVKDEAILHSIKEIGIDYAQGEYVSESIALEKIATAGLGVLRKQQ